MDLIIHNGFILKKFARLISRGFYGISLLENDKYSRAFSSLFQAIKKPVSWFDQHGLSLYTWDVAWRNSQHNGLKGKNRLKECEDSFICWQNATGFWPRTISLPLLQDKIINATYARHVAVAGWSLNFNFLGKTSQHKYPLAKVM